MGSTATNELRDTALAKLVERGIDPSKVLQAPELEQLRVTFEELDESKDGSVDAAELRRAIADSSAAPYINEIAAERLLEATDIDGDGKLSLDELIMTAARRRLRVLEQQAWNTFSDFDADADGVVVRSELARLVEAGAAPDDVDRVFEDVDGDGNDKIDYAEFLAWYTDHHR